MKILYVYNSLLGKTPKFAEEMHLYKDAAVALGHSFDALDNVEVNTQIFHRQLANYDAVIFMDKDVYLAELLEAKGYNVFNSSKAIRICDSKAHTYTNLLRSGIAQPETIVSPFLFDIYEPTENNYSVYAKNVCAQLGLPLVCKGDKGSFGNRVALLNTAEDVLKVLNSVKTAVVFQKFISESAGTDIRLQVVGDSVVASMRRQAQSEDFRSNITNGGKASSYTAPQSYCDLAIDAAKCVGADFAGVDIIVANNGPIVCEINSNAHINALTKVSGINVAASIIKYVEIAVKRRSKIRRV